MRHWQRLVLVSLVLALSYYFFSGLLGRVFESISKEALNFYIQTAKVVESSYSKYFAQASSIESLRLDNKILSEQALTFNSQLKTLKQDLLYEGFEGNKSFFIANANVLGYSALPNMFRVWIKLDGNTTDNALGLVVPLSNKIDSVACGIAASKSTGWEGYLNGDSRCSYSVFVGAKKAPGILHGRSNGSVIIRFIPAWVEIKVGDEVIASGIDMLFFEGAKVGVVKEINTDNTFNEAVVEPYCNSFAPSRYYAIRKND